ncbi:MAG TPA: pitrilysin family protein [Solirubrobacteraceae bacterium]|nr:pitrilysin family protein [Solirubrobacteraceae bacterium]
MARNDRLTRLDSGVRVVTEAMPSVRSVALGFWIAAGSRLERDSEAGLSHLLEHLLFKGSDRFDSLEIDQIFDSMGAEINAGTGKETTSVYARVLDRHLERAFEVMCDMVWAPAFREVDTEREVVLEEIAMYEDDPQDKVFDVLGSAVFDGDPLARPILGRAEVIRDTAVEDIRAFHRDHYRADNVVVAAAGSIDHDRLVQLVRDFDPSLAGGPAVTPNGGSPAGQDRPRVRFERKDTEQYHVCLGAAGLARDDDRRFALRVLDNILGGTSSSRLFQEVREKRGLAYGIYSFANHYAGTGQIGLYVGTRADNLEQSVAVIVAELERLTCDPASEQELERSKDNVKGRLVLSLESTAAHMNRLGSSLLADIELLSVDDVIERIDAVTLDDLHELAELLWRPQRLSAAGIGPDQQAFSAAISSLGGNWAPLAGSTGSRR